MDLNSKLRVQPEHKRISNNSQPLSSPHIEPQHLHRRPHLEGHHGPLREDSREVEGGVTCTGQLTEAGDVRPTHQSEPRHQQSYSLKYFTFTDCDLRTGPLSDPSLGEAPPRSCPTPSCRPCCWGCRGLSTGQTVSREARSLSWRGAGLLNTHQTRETRISTHCSD